VHIHPDDEYELQTMKKALVGTMSAKFKVNLSLILFKYSTFYLLKTTLNFVDYVGLNILLQVSENDNWGYESTEIDHGGCRIHLFLNKFK
jgi:hypothetical protein